MALKVIGAGFGRTGTLSLKSALELLGFGPCYHMVEVIARPEHSELWDQAARGEAVDWAALFSGFAATVDWPACHFWRELLDVWPEAQVILTRRDPERWYESVRNTIYPTLTEPLPEDAPPWAEVHRRMTRRIILEDTFHGRFEDPDYAIAQYHAHNQAVIDTVSASRLLIFDPTAGWEPLCEFLGVQVPPHPYPQMNSTAEFQQHFMRR